MKTLALTPESIKALEDFVNGTAKWENTLNFVSQDISSTPKTVSPQIVPELPDITIEQYFQMQILLENCPEIDPLEGLNNESLRKQVTAITDLRNAIRAYNEKLIPRTHSYDHTPKEIPEIFEQIQILNQITASRQTEGLSDVVTLEIGTINKNINDFLETKISETDFKLIPKTQELTEDISGRLKSIKAQGQTLPKTATGMLNKIKNAATAIKDLILKICNQAPKPPSGTDPGKKTKTLVAGG